MRVCKVCSKEMVARQGDYCSFTCHHEHRNLNRRKIAAMTEALPTREQDDLIELLKTLPKLKRVTA